jgi:glyoxylase-like metal-dependent hydrolase (beta-lactamase superfamily II)
MKTNEEKLMCQPVTEGFYDQASGTITYVIYEPRTRDAVIIDPVLDFDPVSGRTSTDGVDRILDFIGAEALRPRYVLETHVHADHLTSAGFLRDQFGLPVVTGARVAEVQRTFAQLFDLPHEDVTEAAFDVLLEDGDVLNAGELTIHTLFTPGHTPACVSYLIGEACFVGDALFMPDFGTGRCDFPGGDAARLYDSIQKILALPEWTTIHVGHDYGTDSRSPKWETTVAEEKVRNRHLAEVTRSQFVRMRREKDAGLDLPRLILPAIQVNVRAGTPPMTDDAGRSFLKIPMNAF